MKEATANSITLSNKKNKKATIQKQLLRPGSAATEPANKIYNKMEIISNNENKSVCDDSFQQTQQYSQQFPVIQKQLPISSVKVSIKPKTLEFNDSAGFTKKPSTQQIKQNKQQTQRANMSKSSNQFSSAYNKLSDKAKDVVNEEIQKIASGPFKNKKPIAKPSNEFADINLKVVNDTLPKSKRPPSKKLEPIKQVEQEQVSGLLRKSIESTQPSQFAQNDSWKFQFGGDFTALSSQIKVQEQSPPDQNKPSGNLLMNLLQEADALSLPPIQTMNDNLATKQQQQKELQEYLLDIKSRVQFPKNFEKITEDAYSYLRSSRNNVNEQWDELVSQSVENSINSSKMLEKRQENDKSKIALLDRVIEAKEREQRELEESRMLDETMSQVSQPDMENKLFLTLQKSSVSQKKSKKDGKKESKISKVKQKQQQENSNINKRYSESYFVELNKELAGKFGQVVRYSELLSEEEQKKLEAMVKDIEISYKNAFKNKKQMMMMNPENEETPFSMSLEVRERVSILDKQLSDFSMEENEKTNTVDEKIKSKQSKFIVDEIETQEMKKKLQEINGKLRSITEVNETIESSENIQKEVEKLKTMNLEIMASNNEDEVPKFIEAMDRLNELYSEGQNQFNDLSTQKDEIVNSLQQSENELNIQIKVLQNEANEAQKKSAEINSRVDKTTNNKKYSEILQILEQMDNYEDWIKKETDRITSIEERIAKELQEQVYEMAVIPEENNQQQEESKVIPLPIVETGKTLEEYEKQFEDEVRNESPELFEVDQSDPSDKAGTEEESPLTGSQVVVVQEELAKQRNEIEELKSKVSSFDQMLDTLWNKFSEHKIEEEKEEGDALNDSLEEQK